MLRSYYSLSFRQLRTRRLRVLLTAAGIVLGVGMICGVLLLAATIQRTFTDLYDSVYGQTDLVVSGSESTGSLPLSSLERVRDTEGVEDASGSIFAVLSLVGEDGRVEEGSGSTLNVTGDDPRATDFTDWTTTDGREIEGGREIQLEQSWADANGIEVGDRIRLAAPDGLVRLRVVGLLRFSSGLDFGGEGFASMPLSTARRAFDKPDVYDEIAAVVSGDDEGTVEKVQTRLEDEFGKGVEVATPEAKGEDIQRQLQAFNVVLYFFAGMALFVGGFLIFNSFNMTVLQRMREIGMQRTLGATRPMIVRSVLLEALALGAVGAVLGLGLGVLLALALIALMRAIDFPVGELELTWIAPVAAVATGMLTAVLGALEVVTPEPSEEFHALLGWADEVRRLKVRANADNPEDATLAIKFGAQGIGLCRTEHMFFEENRRPIVQEMILAETEAERRRCLDQLLPFQRGDFEGIFLAMDGRPVTIRLIDPPLHEFLPSLVELVEEVATLEATGEDPGRLAHSKMMLSKVRELHEINPMLGLRGCRLSIMFPEIVEMQTRAILEGAAAAQKKGAKVLPEIMIPLVGHVNELKAVRTNLEAAAEQVTRDLGVEIDYSFGTMIEIPRAALTADEIAEHAEFFSFGTNDLTQTTYGFSRDDAEDKFLKAYVEQKVLPSNPFEALDRIGVGKLMRICVDQARAVRPAIKLGICGEHGGEPSSIAFCHELGLDYVSCSPFRVPIARLASAQAALTTTIERDGWCEGSSSISRTAASAVSVSGAMTTSVSRLVRGAMCIPASGEPATS